MASTDSRYYVGTEDHRKLDLCVYRKDDGSVWAEVHWRDSGYTGYMPVNRIVHVECSRKCDIGGTARWKELRLYYGEEPFVVKPMWSAPRITWDPFTDQLAEELGVRPDCYGEWRWSAA